MKKKDVAMRLNSCARAGSRLGAGVAWIVASIALGSPLAGCLGDRPTPEATDGGGTGGATAGTGGRDGGLDTHPGTGGAGAGGNGAGGSGAGTGGIVTGTGGTGDGGLGTGGGIVAGTGGVVTGTGGVVVTGTGGGIITGTGGVVTGTGGVVTGTGGSGTGGAAMLSFDMSSYAAGTVAVGSSGMVTLTLRNNGSMTSGALPAIATTGDASFTVAGGTCAQGSGVAGGSSCTIAVRFQPTSYGNKSGSLALTISPGGSVMATVTGVGQQTFTLTVNKTGSTGTGTVTSIPAGDINCDASGTKCTNTYTVTTSAPPSLMLHPAAGASSVFGGWGGDCSSYGTNDCQLTMNANRTATAVFTAQYTVTVSFAGAGAGTVVVQPSNTTCTAPTACTVTVTSGTALTLTAKPTNSGNTVSSVLTGWMGACAGNGPLRFCNLTVTGNTSTTARFDTLPANLAFVTSKTFAGNLGGATAYQTQCNSLATAAGINNAAGNAYIAWMAASNYAPVSLLGTSRGWVRADLMPWIDTMSTALAKGNVYYPVAYDEDGRRVIDQTLAGMNQQGTFVSGYNCADWTDATGNSYHGSTHASGTAWTNNNVGISSCGDPSRVLCLSKGVTATVSPPSVAGKRIFLTQTGWVPAGGISGADTKCNADKPASVASSKALLVASTRALTDVINPTTTYIRPDGTKIGVGADIIAAMGTSLGPATLESPITQDGAGNYVNTGVAQFAWVGVKYVGTADKDTCRDWGSSASTDSGTIGGIADGWLDMGDDGSWGCNNNFNNMAIAFLQCVEQ